MKALEINRGIFGEDHVNYAKILESLSEILRKQGDYIGAKEGFLKVL
jgi:hypothetical protein